MERGSEKKSAELRYRLTEGFKYVLYSFPLTILIFGVFMVARGIKDEHISGAFALFPVALILLIFFGAVILEFIKEVRKSRSG